MTTPFPPDFELSLCIALKMIPRGYRLDYAGKLPHQTDAGSREVARVLVHRLQMQGWTITGRVVVPQLADSVIHARDRAALAAAALAGQDGASFAGGGAHTSGLAEDAE